MRHKYWGSSSLEKAFDLNRDSRFECEDAKRGSPIEDALLVCL